MAKLTHT